MFQFPHLPLSPYYRPKGPSDESDRTLLLPGFPIRVSAGQSLFTALRGFSQSTTPFFGSWRQGIHHTPLVACYICLGIGKTEVLLIHFLRFFPGRFGHFLGAQRERCGPFGGAHPGPR